MTTKREEVMRNKTNRNPDRRIGLKVRQRVLELANQGLSLRRIAERVGITALSAKKILAQGLRHCTRCGRLTERAELCPVCSLPANAPFCDRLKAFRTVADVSQMALALKIDVPESWVRNWEKGRMRPTEPELQTLAEALGLTVQELIGKAEPQNGA